MKVTGRWPLLLAFVLPVLPLSFEPMHAAEITADARSETRPGSATATRRICFAIGPVRDHAQALDISGRYAARQTKTALKTSLDKHYLGIMVYVDGHASRAEAKETAGALAAKGIRDHIIINSKGRLHLLSLGVSGDRRSAERLRARIERHGFAARLERLFREQTVYFVFGEWTGRGGLPELLDGRDVAEGVFRFPTPCPPG